MVVRCRRAPSPTGKNHLGNLYIFLFNNQIVKKYGRELLLRIDDTEVLRSKAKDLEDIKQVCRTFDINTINRIFQSKRTSLYDRTLAHLAKMEFLFQCLCSSECCLCENKEENYSVNFSLQAPIHIHREAVRLG